MYGLDSPPITALFHVCVSEPVVPEGVAELTVLDDDARLVEDATVLKDTTVLEDARVEDVEDDARVELVDEEARVELVLVDEARDELEELAAVVVTAKH